MTETALQGLRVIECAQSIAGPFCGKLLADMGAEVIKIEPPDLGDASRQRGPFPDDLPDRNASGLFLYLNTNKLGITLDIAHPHGQKVLQRLVAQADVLIEDHTPSIAEQLRLTYEALKAVNPGLVVASITPFGRTGPYRDFKGNDLVVAHMAGLGWYTPGGPITDHEQEPPLRPGGHQTDFMAGLTAAGAVLTAVLGRDLTGEGQQLDISAQDAAINTMRTAVAYYSYEGVIGGRSNPAASSRASQPCKDGYVRGFDGAAQDRNWAAMVEVMGNPEWAKDERFQTQESRLANYPEVQGHVREWLLQHTKEEIYHAAQANHITCFPVYTMEELVNYSHLRDREFFVEVENPVAGPVVMPGAPVKYSETPWRLERAAPLLGEHNEAIFCERLGYSREELVRLRQMEII